MTAERGVGRNRSHASDRAGGRPGQGDDRARAGHAVPAIGDAVHRDRLDEAAIGAERIVVAAADRVVVAQQDVADLRRAGNVPESVASRSAGLVMAMAASSRRAGPSGRGTSVLPMPPKPTATTSSIRKPLRKLSQLVCSAPGSSDEPPADRRRSGNRGRSCRRRPAWGRPSGC